MNRIFIGVDQRQYVAYHVLAHSLMRHASKPISITPLIYNALHPTFRRTGLTEFTYTRYAVPYLCDYAGDALFMDADMLVRGDICQLFDEASNDAVSVAPVERKFERVSLMYFNNFQCTKLTPHLVNKETPQNLDSWAASVGTLDRRWNHTVPYDGHHPDPMVVHYTQGIPCFPETENCDYAEDWRNELDMAISTVPWEDLMGASVHKQEMGL